MNEDEINDHFLMLIMIAAGVVISVAAITLIAGIIYLLTLI